MNNHFNSNTYHDIDIRDLPARQARESIPSAELLAPTGALRIAHQGAIYILRVTRNGGLILTK